MFRDIIFPAITEMFKNAIEDWVDLALYNGEHIPKSRKNVCGVPGAGGYTTHVVGGCVFRMPK